MAKYIENGRPDNTKLLKLKSSTRSNNTLSNIILYCADIVIVISICPYIYIYNLYLTKHYRNAK